ncbi:ankyrin [Hypoxylon sp. NC0597]|nr:ankyrin [Hypoxylon sp. NC0597]
MEYLLSLPVELILDIIEYINDVPDLHALAATSRCLNYITSPILYSLGARKYPYLLCWACGAGLRGVVEKLLVVGANPNLPTVGANPLDELLLFHRTRSSLNLRDPLNVLYKVYGHQEWKQGPPRRLSRETQVTSYNPNVHLVTEEYIGGDISYWFPLHAAAMSGSIEIIKLLFDFGAHLNPPSRSFCCCHPSGLHKTTPSIVPNYYWTPLHTALCCCNESTANFLLGLGASPNVELRERQSNALHWAARGSFLSTTKLLLEGGSNVSVDVQAPNGATPLIWALGTERSTEIMTYLIEHGANIDVRVRTIDAEETTALMEACFNRWYKDAAFLINAGVMIHSILPTQPSALDQCLISLGAGLNEVERMLQNRLESREIYLRHNLDFCREHGHKLGRLALPPCPSSLNESAHCAAIVELTKMLIRKSANVNTSTGTRHPLVRASAARLIPIIELLLASGADVDHEDDEGLFSLLVAVPDEYVDWEDDHFEVMEPLLKHGADPNKMNKFGQTALMRTCYHAQRTPNQLEIVKLLVKYGADINIRSPICLWGSSLQIYGENHTRSPLQITFYKQKYEICRYFMDQGAEVSHEKADLMLMLEDFTYFHCQWQQDVQWDSEVEINEPPYRKNVYPRRCRANLCAPLRILLSIDHSGWLAKDPRSFWLSTGVFDYPLTHILLDAGASDASWIEDNESCLYRFLFKFRGISRDNPDINRARHLISIGADVNVVTGSSSSPLANFLQNPYAIDHIEDGGVTNFIEVLALLVDNGLIPNEEELWAFKELISSNRVRGGFGYIMWDMLAQENVSLSHGISLDGFGHSFQLNLRRELRRQFVVEGDKIARRKWLTYGDVALSEGGNGIVTGSGSSCS